MDATSVITPEEPRCTRGSDCATEEIHVVHWYHEEMNHLTYRSLFHQIHQNNRVDDHKPIPWKCNGHPRKQIYLRHKLVLRLNNGIHTCN